MGNKNRVPAFLVVMELQHPMDSLRKLLDFLNMLGEKNIHYRLTHVRDEAIMIEIAVPGSRWEVEFFAEGQVEVEVFTSSGHIEGEEALARLFEQDRG